MGTYRGKDQRERESEASLGEQRIDQSRELPNTQRSRTVEGNRGQKTGNKSVDAEEGPRVVTDANEQRSGDTEAEGRSILS